MYSNAAIEEAQQWYVHRDLNGVSHGALTYTAYSVLASDLERYGNILSEAHRCALMELVGTLTKYAQGVTTGRLAMALPTGMGKTSAIIAWASALHQLGLDHVSVSVSASKVEALCSIKRALIDHGVPEQKIGLKHSVGHKASMQSTGDSDRPIMLVTHQRVRTSVEHKLFTQHKGKPRDVMLYDESLFRSDSYALSERGIRMALAWFREDVRGNEKYDSLLSYLGTCSASIAAALDELKTNPDAAEKVITLPEKLPIELNGYLELLGSRVELDDLRTLINVSQNPLRLALTGQADGVLFYQLAVPEDLKNVLVLDASYPVRTLVQMDDTIEEGLLYSSGLELKRFDNVTIHQMLSHGGRHSVTESMREQRKDKRKISLEVAEVIKGIPEEEAVLVFTFKKKPTDRVDILQTLKDDLRAAGINLDATTPDGKQRINFLTWGDETSLNTVSYCQNVILAGVLHRGHLDIASAIVGQRDDLSAGISNTEITSVINSEIDHMVYQALSRGSCREVNDGQAKPMTAWIIHKDMRLRHRLAKVMPGAVWKAWDSVHGEANGGGITSTIALQVLDYLNKLPEDVTKVSTRKVKEDLQLEAADRSFTRAVDIVDTSGCGWIKDGRSLVRQTFGFTDES